MERIFVDTNALFPISLCDLLLRLAEFGMYELKWTEDLLAELQRALTAGGRRSPTSAARICAGIRETFPEGEIARKRYEHLITRVPGPDQDDRVHAAAAIADGCARLITNDKTGFPIAALRHRGLQICRPDDYLVELIEAYPTDLVAVVEQMASDKACPPMSVEDVLHALERAGVPNFVQRVEALL